VHKRFSFWMLDVVKSYINRLRFYDRITKMSKILRRYFVMNAFDGALTIFGLLVGAFISNVSNAEVILGIGLSTSVAISISGLWGAFLTESAERMKDRKELERLMLVNLEKTEINAAAKVAVFAAALVDALAPVLACIFILLPFFAVELDALLIEEAYVYSFLLSFATFFALGVFLGHISKENIIVSGSKMLLAGLTSAAITWLLGAHLV